MIPQSFKVAVVQAAPVIFNRKETLAKVKALAGDASAVGAKIVLFPEAFVSGYPRGLDFGAVVGARSDRGRKDYQRYWESSVDIPGAASMSSARSRRAIRYSWLLALLNGTVEHSTVRSSSSPLMGCYSESIGRSCRLDRNDSFGDSVTAPHCQFLIRHLEKWVR